MIKILIISLEIKGKYRVEGSRLITGGSTANKTFSSDFVIVPICIYYYLYGQSGFPRILP